MSPNDTLLCAMIQFLVMIWTCTGKVGRTRQTDKKNKERDKEIKLFYYEITHFFPKRVLNFISAALYIVLHVSECNFVFKLSSYKVHKLKMIRYRKKQ